jgi:hypothetical protein
MIKKYSCSIFTRSSYKLKRSHLCKCMLSIERVHAQMTEGGAEEVLLGAVLEQRGLQRSCCYLAHHRGLVWHFFS